MIFLFLLFLSDVLDEDNDDVSQYICLSENVSHSHYVRAKIVVGKDNTI